MNISKSLLILLPITLFVSACKKSGIKATPAPDVYAAGVTPVNSGTGTTATYWKNGTKTTFNSNKVSSAQAIAVNGNDVYVVGSSAISNQTVATLWKNGIPTLLADSSVYSAATGIVIQGSDIFISGTIGDNAVYWKNGQVHTLSQISGVRASSATVITVDGNDIYMAGYAVASTQSAAYWKNGNPVQVATASSGILNASAIAVYKGDIYVAATIYGLLLNKATVWDNGTAISMANSYLGQNLSTTADAMAISNGHIYLAGTGSAPASGTVYGSPAGQQNLLYWVDGTINTSWPAVQAASIHVSGIAIDNNDVYVAANINSAAMYYKNGIAFTLASGSFTGINALIIVPKSE